MTDLEITKLCAEAMCMDGIASYAELISARDKNGLALFDPLYNDAQAMALVRKFKLWVHPTDRGTWNAMAATGIGDSESLNRAICEAVAKMQQARGTGTGCTGQKNSV